MEADVCYKGGVKVEISSEILFNFPIKNAAAVPLSFTVILEELEGTVIGGIRNKYFWISFIKEPFMKISIESEVKSYNLSH